MYNDCKELDILQKMVMKPKISFIDKQDLICSILEFTEEIILQDPMLYARSNYKDIIVELIKEFLEIQLAHVYKNYNIYEYDKFLNDIIEESLSESDFEKKKNKSQKRFHLYHCVICGEFLGYTNPRQLCKKTYCENEE